MKNNKSGFTLVELLVVLLIIAILAAIATPLYMQNAQRARASEAVATMSLIRQALRDHRINTNNYIAIAEDGGQSIGAGNIQDPIPTGVNVGVGATQYFSNGSYFVELQGVAPASGQSGLLTSPPVVDFLITADGENSFPCSTTAPANDDQSCAVRALQVKGITAAGATLGDGSMLLEMDNSGRIAVSYDDGDTWELY